MLFRPSLQLCVILWAGQLAGGAAEPGKEAAADPLEMLAGGAETWKVSAAQFE